jgi:hypothetical protein
MIQIDSNLLNIIYLLIIWSLGWSIYFYSAKKNLKLAKDAEISIFYFLCLAFLVFLLIKKQLAIFTIDHISYYFFAVLLVFFGVNHIYFILRKNFKTPWSLIEEHPTDHWLEANRLSIFITTSHIIFQQTIITGLIIFLRTKFPDAIDLSVALGVLFGLMHIPLFYFKGFKFAVLYLIPAFIAGFVFANLLIRFEFGFILNYLVHWAFYVFITSAFWLNQGKK